MTILTTQSLKNFWQTMQGKTIPLEHRSTNRDEQQSTANQENKLPINHSRLLGNIALIVLIAVGIAYAARTFVSSN